MPRKMSVLLLLLLAVTTAGNTQKGTKPISLPSDSNTSSAPLAVQDTEPFALPGAKEETPLSVLAAQARLREEDRTRHLVADTAKLVDLATRLQADVNRAGSKNVLSLENLRRTEEIEKLARKVRERLKS